MRTIDWIIVGVVALSALGGLRRGLVATVLVLGGLVLGGFIGSRLGPQLLHGGSRSPYTPVAALGGAVAGAIIFRILGATLGALFRANTRLTPPLRALDSVGGLIAGAAWGLLIVWVPRLRAPPLRSAAPVDGTAVAILGYPEDGPYDARAGRLGATTRLLVNGTPRVVTAISGLIRHGNSGGPAIDAKGVVRSTIFAARLGAPGGYGTPSTTVKHVLATASGPVANGGC